MLLTYQGDWGILPLGDLSIGAPEEQVLACARRMPAVHQLWFELREFSLQTCDWLKASAFSCCLEVCEETWTSKDTLRIHAHVAFKKDTSQLRCQSQYKCVWMGSVPHKQASCFGRNSARAANSVLYYCQAPKKYQLLSTGSLQPFVGYPVNPEWIFAMIENRKLSYLNARHQLIFTGKGLSRRLHDLDTWHKANEVLELQEHSLAVQQQIRSTNKPFRTLIDVDTWLERAMQPYQPRKKMLVLTGPSRMGKTEYVRSLFPLGAVLELNCAGLEHVCLQDFSAVRHKCIMWDEVHPRLVASNRKLFQHPACWLDMNHSPTGQHVLRLWVNDACSILLTNSWEEDLQTLEESAAAWVRANTIVLSIYTKLWFD